ncbi:prostaglandin E synthase-like [Petromyzon marinus]|uniref:prostaglandin E synthase-like n=1 Tax=Petromyzon marinus TaxID=7757 RepID=UPI003F715D32
MRHSVYESLCLSHPQAFANVEDAMRHGGIQFCRSHPYVERSPRAHRNAMENVFPFILLGALYVLLAGPSPSVARAHFRVFAGARFAHLGAYLLSWPAPSRSLAHLVSLLTNLSMAAQVLWVAASEW